MSISFGSEAFTELSSDLIYALKKKRKEKKVSCRDLSKVFGVNQTTFGKIERMERRLELTEFILICKYLEIDPIEIINSVIPGTNLATG